MTVFALTLAEVGKLGPCWGRYAYALKHLPADAAITAAQARAAGCTFADLVWVATAQAREDPAVERRLRLWLADCAAHVLPIFYKAAPADPRPAQAIKTSRAFANGEVSDAARDAAWAAARVAARAAAGDAAWAAAWAAAGDAAWAAAGAAAGDAARAAAGDAARAAAGDAARDAESAWQFDRLVLWLSDDEPEVLALPEPSV